jgi:hypothetical protein
MRTHKNLSLSIFLSRREHFSLSFAILRLFTLAKFVLSSRIRSLRSLSFDPLDPRPGGR